MIATLFIALFVLLFLGTPVFVALGLSAVLALVGFSDLPLMGVAQRLINGVDKFSLLAVPFCIHQWMQLYWCRLPRIRFPIVPSYCRPQSALKLNS